MLAEALAGERREAGPKDEPPSYEAIDSNPINSLFMTLFRAKVVERVGWDSPLEVGHSPQNGQGGLDPSLVPWSTAR